MMNTHQVIAQLIARRVIGTPLTGQEQQMLDEWLQDESHRRVLAEVEGLALSRRVQELERRGYGRKMADRFLEELHRRQRRRFLHRYLPWISGVAALFLLVLSFAFFATDASVEKAVPHTLAQNSILPGEAKATLTLADGREFGMTENNGTVVGEFIDSVAHADAREIPETDVAFSRVPIYNKLNVPRGGEFYHRLADGTGVWLNSDSELRFPDSFPTDDERRVYLRGEAFFEVSKDTRPFIVSTRRGDIRVYGTRFCITDYEEAPFSTVLVEGSIGFSPEKGGEAMLKPSQRLIYDSRSGDIQVETVDVSLYTGWVAHYYLFRGQTLEEIMNTLSRWYNFNVVFTDNALRNIRLSGRLYRNENVQVLLESYAKICGIRFEMRDNNILISK